jgi:branched-chain amino acid transport system permease protein
MSSPAARRLAVVAAAAAALVAPQLLGDLTFFMHMVLAAMVVTGLSVFMGFAGQASLGQGAFFAVGALTVALLTTRWQLPPVLALLAAPVVAAVFATVVGMPLLRLRGHYLAFGTLALLLMVQTAMKAIGFLGGSFGITGIPAFGVGSFVFTDQRQYAYLALGCLAALLLVTHRVVHSRFGRGVRALAGSETAAASAGVPVMRSKLAVFALAAVFAGLAGGISAFFTPYVSPDSFPALESFTYVIMVVVGGLGSVWGGLLGAVLVSVLLQVLNTISSRPDLPDTTGPILQYAAYGMLLVLAMLFAPRGIGPTAGDRLQRMVGRSHDAT